MDGWTHRRREGGKKQTSESERGEKKKQRSPWELRMHVNIV